MIANARLWPPPRASWLRVGRPRGVSSLTTGCRRTASSSRRPALTQPRPLAATLMELCSCSPIGAVVPRKGYDVLIASLATLSELPWRLSIAGDLGRDPECAAALEKDIARFRLEARVTLFGAVPSTHLVELYANADVFVLASRFEGYGIAYAEAIARGLPVIGTTAGAIPDTVPAGAGVLVSPNDEIALARALRRVIAEPGERAKLAACAPVRR